MGLWQRIFTLDQPSPRDIIKQSQINYDERGEKIIIEGIKPPVWITTVADTNSMDGLFDIGHTVLLTGRFNRNKLSVGDIIVFEPPDGPYTGRTIIHRIVKIRRDRWGRYYKTKGDNCIMGDPWKLRSANLRYLCVGIIY